VFHIGDTGHFKGSQLSDTLGGKCALAQRRDQLMELVESAGWVSQAAAPGTARTVFGLSLMVRLFFCFNLEPDLAFLRAYVHPPFISTPVEIIGRMDRS
jgi:hypothetical protein